MKKIQLVIALCTIVFFSTFAQNKGSEIPAVELLDSALISEIESVIAEQEFLNSSSETGFFADGKGYIVVEIQNYLGSDMLNRYLIHPDQNTVEPDNLPNAYAFVGNRPVLIYYSNSSLVYQPVYSAKSIKKFQLMIDRFLAEPEHIKSRNESGKVVIDDKNFRESYIFSGATRVLLTFRNNAPKSANWRDGEPVPL